MPWILALPVIINIHPPAGFRGHGKSALPIFVLSRNDRKKRRVMHGRTWRSHFHLSFFSVSASHVATDCFSSSMMTSAPLLKSSVADISILLMHWNGLLESSLWFGKVDSEELKKERQFCNALLQTADQTR